MNSKPLRRPILLGVGGIFLLLISRTAGLALEPGTLPKTWITGGPNCLEVPDWRIHAYNPTFYILRESGCTHYEKPFLYLILGRDRGLLVDTGAGASDAAVVVQKLLRQKPLVVMHSHQHSDHTAGDKGFAGMIETRTGEVDLGGRIVDVIAIPGHEAAHIAFYDRATGILLTGDHLYPGRLYVRDFAAYLASTRKLVEFTETRSVAHILGCHIEQSSTPFVDYPVGTRYQPEEHVLELGRGHLLELLAGLEAMHGKPVRTQFGDFTVWPK